MSRGLAWFTAASCLVILGGALGASWYLGRDVEPSVAPSAAPEMLEGTSVATPVAVREVPVPAPAPIPPMPAAPAEPRPPPPEVGAAAPAPAPPVAEPPAWDDESVSAADVSAAWSLATAERSSPVEWRRAAETFQRCLTLVATNERCREGLAVARERLRSVDPRFRGKPGSVHLPDSRALLKNEPSRRLPIRRQGDGQSNE